MVPSMISQSGICGSRRQAGRFTSYTLCVKSSSLSSTFGEEVTVIIRAVSRNPLTRFSRLLLERSEFQMDVESAMLPDDDSAAGDHQVMRCALDVKLQRLCGSQGLSSGWSNQDTW